MRDARQACQSKYTIKVNVCDDGQRPFNERIFEAMTKRKLAASRRQLTLSSREVLVAGIFIVVVASMCWSVDAASTAAAVTAGQFHLVAVLPAVNFSDWTAAFQEAVSATAVQDGSALRSPGVALSAAGGVRTVVGEVCAAVERHNVSAIVVVGDQDIINTVLVVARHLGVPLLGYNDAERRAAISPVSPRLRRQF